jgi:hypothetical protein
MMRGLRGGQRLLQILQLAFVFRAHQLGEQTGRGAEDDSAAALAGG